MAVSEVIDEFHGQGGSFVINPETGLRELVERTAENGESAVDQPVEENDDAAA